MLHHLFGLAFFLHGKILHLTEKITGSALNRYYTIFLFALLVCTELSLGVCRGPLLFVIPILDGCKNVKEDIFVFYQIITQ